MKKFTLKALFMAAALGMGGNAWAETTTIYERGISTAWSNSDLNDWVLSGTGVSSIETTGLKFAKTVVERSEYTYTKSITTTDDAIVYMDVAWIVENANGSGTAGCYFTIGDVRLFWCGQNRDLKITIGGTETTLISGGNTNLRGTTFNVSLSIDKATKAVDYSISNSAYNSGTAITGKGTVSSSDVTSVVFGWARGGQQNVSSQIVKSINITEEEQEVKKANYTINYKLGNAIVKTVSSQNTVGAAIVSDIAIDGEGDYAGNHYLITAESAPSMVLGSGTNELDVPVRAPYTATLNVTTTIGTSEPTLVTTNLVETDSKVCAWSYAYPMYVQSGDVYYKADNTTTFGEGGTFTNGEVINKSVTYSTADENVVFFTDNNNTAGTNYTYSNGNTSYVGAQNARGGDGNIRGIGFITLDAGSYEFITYFTARNGRGLVIRDDNNAADPMFGLYTDKNDASTGGLRSGIFSVDVETTCVINGANSGEVKTNQSEDFDYILIKKIPATVSKSITSAGYATYCSPYALDFSTTGLTAYIATYNATDKKVSFSEVTSVPANTGVLLKGDEGSYNIPVVASSATDVAGNVFVGVTENTVVPAGIFVLLNGGQGVGFYQTESAFTVGANTAYISVPTEVKARFIGVDEDDDATAITAIEATEAVNNGVIYNLSGQRVVKPLKGIYIQNGKKFIVK